MKASLKILILILFANTLMASEIKHISFDQAIQKSDTIAVVEIIKSEKSSSRCRTDHSFLLKVTSVLKGKIKLETILPFYYSHYHFKRKNYFWQEDCLSVSYIVPPIAENMQKHNKVVAAIKTYKKGYKVLGVHELNKLKHNKKDTIKIFNRSSLPKKTEFFEKFDSELTYSYFKPGKENLSVSVLGQSMALQVTCSEQIQREITNAFSSNNKDSQFKLEKNQNCVKVIFKNSTLYAFQSKAIMSKNKKIKENFVWAGSEKDSKIKTLYNIISKERFDGDSRMIANIEAVADMNNDGAHEIIISEIMYAGMGYLIIQYDGKKQDFKKFGIDGRSWD